MTDTATQTPPAPGAAQESPYVGLAYFTEDNAGYFFGRESERKRIIGNLRAARLTLLYAQSGVGKSSLLRAGAVARLRELAVQGLAQRGSARHVPVVFSTWGDEPVAALVGAIEDGLRPFLPTGEVLELPRDDLMGTIEAATSASEATLLLILDQFEEYFLYHSAHQGEGTFAEQLAACVNRGDLKANFLIAIREDAYAGLGDLFKGRMANVYGNYLHLEFLRREAAREAIVRPIELFNELHPGAEPIAIEPELVDAVLDQVARGAILIGEGGRGQVGSGSGDTSVETPYLQLVMKRLWDEEVAAGSRTLRLATLEAVGGAATIISTHLDQAMSGFPENEQDVAAAVLRYLVTPSGSKIALSVPDLAQLAEVPTEELVHVVERLSAGDVRILRPVAPGEGGGTRFEIFHDALARPILDWRARYTRAKQEQQLAARVAEERRQKEEAQKETLEAQERERRERQRARRFLILIGLCIVAMLVGSAAFAYALVQKSDADSQTRRAQSIVVADRAAEAAGNPDLGPVAAGLGALEGFELSPSFEADSQTLAFLDANAGSPSKILVGHTFKVTSVAYSRAGLLASGSNDGSIRLWDSNGDPVGTPRVTPSLATVNALAFSPNGRLLAAARGDGSVDLWDVSGSSARPIKSISAFEDQKGAEYVFAGVAFSPDGRTLAGAGKGGHIDLWDVTNPRKPVTRGSLVVPLNGTNTRRISALAFSPDGSTLAATDDAATVTLWDTKTRKLRQTLRQAAKTGQWAYHAAFSPDGRTLAASMDQGIYLWHVGADGHATWWKELVGHGNWVYGVAFASNSVIVSGSRDDNVLVWNVATGRTLGPPRLHRDDVLGVAVSPDGKTIASGGADDLVKLWPLDGHGALATTIGGGPEQLGDEHTYRLSVNDDGVVASANGGRGTELWKVGAGGTARLTAHLPHPGGVSDAVAFHGSLLAASAGKGFVLWHVSADGKAKQLAKSPGPPQKEDVYRLAVNRDGTLVASGGFGDDVVVNLWRVSDSGRSLKHAGSLLKQGQSVNDLAFSPTADLLAVADDDGHFRLWNVHDPARPARLAEVEDQLGYQVFRVAFSPDGTLLATGGAGDFVTLWDVTDPTRPVELEHLPQQNSILSLAFSPDGTTLAAGDGNSNVVLWDVKTRRELGGALVGRVGQSPATDTIAFLPDGNYLLSSGRGNAIVAWSAVLWSRDRTQLHDAVCRIAGRNLTASEWAQLFPETKLARHRHKTCSQYPLP